MGRGIRVALGPVALTAAAPQRAEEEKDRSRPHHPQSSSRVGFHFFPSFPPSRERVPLAGAVSFWLPALTSALLKPCRNRPHKHRPRELHNFQPKGYFQREVSDFLPSSALAQHPAGGQDNSSPKPRKAPDPKGPHVAAGAPITSLGSPAQVPAPQDVTDPALSLFFAGYITHPESGQLFPWPAARAAVPVSSWAVIHL